MPDMGRADQILALAQVLMRVPTGNKFTPYMNTPPPIIGGWATELYDKFGVRVDMSAATHELVRAKSPMGNFGPVREVARNTPARGGDTGAARMVDAHTMLMAWLDEHDPDMARRVRDSQHSAIDQAVVLNEIRTNHPEIWEKGQELLHRTPAEQFP